MAWQADARQAGRFRLAVIHPGAFADATRRGVGNAPGNDATRDAWDQSSPVAITSAFVIDRVTAAGCWVFF
ncbi:hypothetical protein [Crateriforma spongiae]|uniref:hypothetical protein n=1 Tax=Crateriforma spongiae TaxID=2724528 RepID=UPI00144587EE|nr:hypothetical protein [Crateriforma spongiae]